MFPLKKRRLVLLEIAAACSFLAACGGGGSGDDAAAGQAETNAEASSDPVVAGLVPSPEPLPGEPGPGTIAHQAEAALAANPDLDTSEQELARERAQSLTIDAGDAGYAKPKVAALDYSNSMSASKQDLLSKFRLVILGGRGGKDINSFTSGIKSRNPNTRIGYYVLFNELLCNQSSTQNYYNSAIAEANRANWWLRKANGARVQWTDQYGACDMNITKWGRRNAAGQTWQQYKARWDYDKVFRVAPRVDFAFSDNTFNVPRVDADWKRIGSNQLKTNSEIIVAQREGQVAYFSALRNLKSSLEIVGNSNSDLNNDQYRQRLNGAMTEGAMGRSWSLETWSTWDAMMNRYRSQLRNTAAPKDAILQIFASNTDYKTIRYGLASALMENGWFMHSPASGTFQPTWIDEYSAPLGTPTQAPPTGPKQNGIWARTYQNGIVLVNPSKTRTASINVGSGYKRLKGTQSPTVNNGQAQSVVTLGPRQGLIMIRR
jgi:hypothetical protein